MTDDKYILKYFFNTVAIFEADKTIIRKIPDEVFYKGISISDGNQEYFLYFLKILLTKYIQGSKLLGEPKQSRMQKHSGFYFFFVTFY